MPSLHVGKLWISSKLVQTPQNNEFNSILEYLKNNHAVSHNIRTLIFVDYPAELKKMYGLDVSHIIAKYDKKILGNV